MHYLENIFLALGSIRANFLRSMLTLLIIAVGITCLVGILTAIDSILFSMSDNFNRLGANSFSVRPLSEGLRSNDRGRRKKFADAIYFEQAMDFKSSYNYGSSKVSVESFCIGNATIKAGEKKTNPTVRVIGIDENYLNTSAFELLEESLLGYTFSFLQPTTIIEVAKIEHTIVTFKAIFLFIFIMFNIFV